MAAAAGRERGIAVRRLQNSPAITRSRALRWLYFLGVVAIPFDGVPGPRVLGELAHEASFFFFGPALLYASLLSIGGLLAASGRPAVGAGWVWRCGCVLLGCILLSGAANLAGIAGANFHDRWGPPKFATAFSVMIYGFGLAWLTTSVVADDWYRRLVLPACLSASLCLVVCLFESAKLHGVNIAPFDAFYTLIHAGSDGSALLWDGSPNLKLLEGWDQRVRSVSFEPPAFGIFTGLIWPWLFCGVTMSRGSRRAVHVTLLIAFTALIALARARTGWLLLSCDIAALAGLRLVFLPVVLSSRPRRMIAVAVACAAGAIVLVIGGFYIASYDAVVEKVVQGDSVSNLTRLAYQITAYKMFLAHPLVGIGLGQFAFGAADFMPSWGFLSMEIRPSLIYPDAPWPSTYSVYARLAAETGLIGLTAWFSIWIATAYRIGRASLAEAAERGRVRDGHYIVLMSIAGIFASGITDDSFRKPLIWIALGAAAGLIGAARGRSSDIRRERGIDAGLSDDGLP